MSRKLRIFALILSVILPVMLFSGCEEEKERVQIEGMSYVTFDEITFMVPDEAELKNATGTDYDRIYSAPQYGILLSHFDFKDYIYITDFDKQTAYDFIMRVADGLSYSGTGSYNPNNPDYSSMSYKSTDKSNKEGLLTVYKTEKTFWVIQYVWNPVTGHSQNWGEQFGLWAINTTID